VPRGAKSRTRRTETPKPIWIKILHGGRYHRHSYLYKCWWPSVERFLDVGGSNFLLSHRLSSSPLQHSQTTVRVCDLGNDRDHQMVIAGGPSRRLTNPRWRTAAILKKTRQITIYLRPFDRSWWNLARWCISALAPDKPLKFGIFEKSAIYTTTISNCRHTTLWNMNAGNWWQSEIMYCG